MNTKDRSKEYVVAEIRRLQSEGHSMKMNDFPRWLKYEISKHFGGWKNAQRELDIVPAKREKYKTKSKYTDEYLQNLLNMCHELSYSSNQVYYEYPRECDAMQRRFGGLTKACEYFGMPKFKRVRRKGSGLKYTEERMRKELSKIKDRGQPLISNQLISNGYGNLVGAVKRHYGTWNNGLKALGFGVEYETPQLNWTKERVKYETLNAIKDGVEPTRTALGKHIRGYGNAVNKLFGSFDNVKEYCGISTIYDRPKEVDDSPRIYRARLTTRDGFKREIIRLYYTGCPLNYNAINERRRHLLDRARELFGTWRDALEYCGFNYDEIVASDNTLSECGEEFEEVLGEILTKLGAKFEKYDHDVLKPDFVLPNGTWIDAKLSEWTNVENTVKRYLPECKELIIVYLQGRKTSRERGYKYKHKALSAYLLTDKMPYDLRDYYNTRLSEIERRASELQSIS